MSKIQIGLIHHFMQNCSRSIENYCFKHNDLVSFRGLCPPDPSPEAQLPLGCCSGLRPQTAIIGSSFRAQHVLLKILRIGPDIT